MVGQIQDAHPCSDPLQLDDLVLNLIIRDRIEKGEKFVDVGRHSSPTKVHYEFSLLLVEYPVGCEL